MRYTNHGRDVVLRRLGKRATFEDVYLTAYYLGYELATTNADHLMVVKRMSDMVRPMRVERLVEWLNEEMEMREIIEPKER